MSHLTDRAYPVGEVSSLTGVTVRTLHHYDEIGLLVPQQRSAAGYRLYTDADLDRLHRILFYRELGFALDAIAELVDSDADPAAHLHRQRELLTERIARLTSMARAIDRELEAQQMGIALTPEERFELFGGDYTDEYEAEAQERWGNTEAYRESRRRTARYSKAEWQQIKDESSAIEQRFAELLAAGRPADSADAAAVAEQHRQHIARWFYDIPPELHRALAQLYVADERFAAHYERIAPGLAEYVSAAIEANPAPF